jgi:hypothetical protein
MGNSVYANGMQISSKSMSGKSICEFPDVCMTPPQTPATPPGVPIPYPNTAMASDTSDGSSSVQIGGQEVMLKDKSFFKQSTGDEAGCAPKKGLMSSTIRGKAYFIAWSMDVKVEGENVVRHLDMTTHNHGSRNANGLVPTVHAALQTVGTGNSCRGDARKVRNQCRGTKDECPGHLGSKVSQQRALYARSADGPSRTEQAGTQATEDAEANSCTKAMRCVLRTYETEHASGGCCPGQTPHHIPPHSMLKGKIKGHTHGSGLCVCMEGASQHVGSHGENHAALDHLAATMKKPDGSNVVDSNGQCTLREYNTLCAKAVAAQCGCSQKCIEDQLNAKHPDQLDKKVTHWQSNSKQLSPELKAKLDKVPKRKPKRR